ncbi:sugar transferase [Enterococcus gallinarum]|uniref:sugar transferase n=1 Tax=Enterococcus TaxID=1350 RepID=UPI0004973D9C|nr:MULTISPECIES: sugar transferase [Enterococcus]MBS7179607.1 sugar transferase [Enterococcus gallinarum]RGC49673.1 sugar transferase [Enterococcus gallinarum]TKL06481.1 sugar transferase [Enterococcus sp. ARL09-542]
MYEKYVKRFLDLVISGLGLVILGIPILIIAFLVRVKLGSPVIFKQERPGKNEKIFKLYKFRTMTDERDNLGRLLDDNYRLTSFGKFLRLTSLDELPELYNIFIGEMSIVGPRPLRVQYLPYYSKTEKKRHQVRPGLTGLAQVNGRNTVNWNLRLEYDVAYVENISFINDLKIIILTIRKVLKREDIVMGNDRKVIDFDEERRNMERCGDK